MGTTIGRKLRVSSETGSEEGLTLLHQCPGCKSLHIINVEKPNGNGATWSWDGNVESPTFSPSINIVGRCHYFIRAGKIEFCSDSTHELAGQTVDLPDLPARYLIPGY